MPTRSTLGETRGYYLPSREPIEIVDTRLDAGHEQTTHRHETVREATLVVEGEVVAVEFAGPIRNERSLATGDFVVFTPGSYHTIVNRSAHSARILTVKYVGSEKDAALFASDKQNLAKDPDLVPAARTDPAQFAATAAHYNTLDALLWGVPGFLAAGSLFAANVITNLVQDRVTIGPLTHGPSLATALTLWGLFYLAGAYAMWRMRVHHDLLVEHLSKADEIGFWKSRGAIIRSKWPPRAPNLFIAFFGLVGLALIGLASYYAALG